MSRTGERAFCSYTKGTFNPSETTWVNRYCDRHEVEFEAIKMRLSESDGYCDCEVLVNSSERVSDSEPPPKLGYAAAETAA